MCRSTSSTCPRLAVFSTWGSTQEVGWVRYALDQFEVPVRPDLQGARQAGRPAQRLRRHRDAEPGPQRQGARVRHRTEGQAARLQEDASASRASACTASPTTSRGGMGLEGAAELQKFVDEGGVLITLGHGELLPGRLRPDAPRRGRTAVGAVSMRPARSSRRRSCSRSIRSSTATRPRRSPCATPTARCCGCPTQDKAGRC